ncbi:MAG: twin-arginine translocase TatA/TatE family subunit [Planctomycetota bacterium]
MAPFAFIQNINPTELMVIAVVAVLVFGRRLPEVAGQAAAHVGRAKREFNKLRRETGIDEEIRDARRTFEQAGYEARRDPNAPTIEPPSSGAGVARNQPWPTDAGETAGPQGDADGASDAAQPK